MLIKKELDALTRQLQDGISNYIGSKRYSAVLDALAGFIIIPPIL